MARNTQLVEIDLRSGIVSNASLYEIGARLLNATNTVWNYKYPVKEDSYAGPWMHRQPQTFFIPSTEVAFTNAKTMRDLAFHANTVLGVSPYVFAIGANSSNQLAVWRSSGGAELVFSAARTTIASGSFQPGCSAYWALPGNDPNGGAAVAAGVGAVIFSHADAARVYYILDDKDPTVGTTVNGFRSLDIDTPGCPAGCASMTVHLDRLWLLTAAATGQSRLYYTDPFNLDSIRSTNVVQIDGRGVCVLPGQFGAIDSSLTPRLVILTFTGVHCLDGDPQLGGGLQADLRTLRQGVGCRSPHAACVTPYGVFFLGTDGGLWLIPPGITAVQSVGDRVADRLAWNNLTKDLDAPLKNAGSLAWYDPYLYIFPGGETGAAYIAEPSSEDIKFWGPVATQGPQRVAIIRTPHENLYTHAPAAGFADYQSMHSIDHVPVQGSVSAVNFHYRAFDPSSSRVGAGGTGLERISAFDTGLINVPGHQVQIMRVILETIQMPNVATLNVPPVWTVTATNEHGTSVTGTLLPEAAVAAGAYSAAVTNVQHFRFPPLTASRGVQVSVSVTSESHLGLVRAFAEIHTTPAQF